MSIFYTARSGFKRGEKSIEAAMNKAMEQDVIMVNQAKITLPDQPIQIKGGVTIEGDPDKKRPVIVATDRHPAFFVPATQNGLIKLKHLDIQLGDNAIGIRVNGKQTQVVLEDVQFYHHSHTTTPYNAVVVDSSGEAQLEITNSVIDLMQADVASATIKGSNIGDWFVDNSQLRITQGSIEQSALQNLLLVGHDETSQLQVRQCMLGGNVRFDNLQVGAQNLQLAQLPAMNHKATNGNVGGDATSLIVGQGTRFSVSHLEQIDESQQNLQSHLKLPAWRALGLIGGSLTISDAYLANASLKNVAKSGDMTFENVTDDSQWSVDRAVKLSNRNSKSQLFDAQSKLNITGNGTGNGDIKQSKSALEQLDRMIGLTGVKKELKQIIAQAKMNAERMKRGLANSDNRLSLNMVFAGSPGTGKTVVARLVAQALYEAGVMKSTKMVEARQADLVGEHVGETAPKTKNVVRSALDGVLFIDEAYELAPPAGGGNSFNNEAVTELIADMENYSNRLVVIMAGYTEDMSDFFRRGNKGLQSRVSKWIEFPDYSPTELKKIERLDLEDSHARLASKNTLIALDKGIDDLLPVVSRSKSAGNGRFVRNYVQKVTEMRDSRLAMQDTSDLTDEQLMIIEPQDVSNAVSAMMKQSQDMQQ